MLHSLSPTHTAAVAAGVTALILTAVPGTPANAAAEIGRFVADMIGPEGDPDGDDPSPWEVLSLAEYLRDEARAITRHRDVAGVVLDLAETAKTIGPGPLGHQLARRAAILAGFRHDRHSGRWTTTPTGTDLDSLPVIWPREWFGTDSFACLFEDCAA